MGLGHKEHLWVALKIQLSFVDIAFISFFWSSLGRGKGLLSINVSLFPVTEHMQNKDCAVNTSGSNVEDSNTVHVAVNRPSKQRGVDNARGDLRAFSQLPARLSSCPTLPTFFTYNHRKLGILRSLGSKGPLNILLIFHPVAEGTWGPMLSICAMSRS